MDIIVKSSVSDNDIDYEEACTALKDYGEKCKESFVFKKIHVLDVDINLLELSKTKYNVLIAKSYWNSPLKEYS